MSKIEIHWQQAQELPERNRSLKAHYLNEFRTSYCDMFTIADWMHYAEKTGWTVEKLRKYARYDYNENFLKQTLYSMLDSELDEDDLYALDI